ncbi:MAG: DUF6503 family protein [Aquaticitalea sp.]
MKYLSIVLFGLMLFNCNEKQNTLVEANDIIKESIEVSGGNIIDSSSIKFDFRDIHYKAVRNNGDFLLARLTVKDTDTIFDLLRNNGFERFINDSLITVPDSMATKYSASINSVHYFSVLPYGLDGKAVNKTYLNTVEINGKNYHKIKVTFNQDGGGEDYEDEFIYWVNTKTFKIDYLAYTYDEADGKGLRFREAFNERYVNGVRFVDYNNFKPKDNNATLENLDRLFTENRLEWLSKIELKDVTVN